MILPFCETVESANMLKMRPATIGRITILKIPSIMFQKSTCINWPANVFIKNGESKVANAVKVTDNARFAFAINDITLDARPLGDVPTSTIPAAISGGKLNIVATEIPTTGIIVYWQITPAITPLGICITPAKSFRLICEPIPNIMDNT